MPEQAHGKEQISLHSAPPALCSRTGIHLPFSHLLLQVFEEVRKLKAPERLKQRQEWRARARARAAQEKEAQPQAEGTPV